jgi:hypothetical protein
MDCTFAFNVMEHTNLIESTALLKKTYILQESKRIYPRKYIIYSIGMYIILFCFINMLHPIKAITFYFPKSRPFFCFYFS